MLPTINGKSFPECTEDDLKEILDNPVFRENEYLDYKKDFSIDHYSKGPSRDAAVAELKSDVCAFANADGGYLIFGIDEDGEGTPKELCGVEIENKDKWELALGNRLQGIKPRVPTYKVAFHSLSNGKYIVVLQITHDFFAPYIHLEDKKNYRIYKRIGNSKKTIEYAELKNMFMQSMVLEKEIEKYRKARVDYISKEYFSEGDKCRYFLFQIFPDTFMDSNYNKSVYALEKKGADFENLFYSLRGTARVLPTVEGLHFISYRHGNDDARINNNGYLEYFGKIFDESTCIYKLTDKTMFGYKSLIEYVLSILDTYISKLKRYYSTKRIVVAISIIGMKDICTEEGFGGIMDSCIDRNELYCNQIVFNDINNKEQVAFDKKRFELDYYYCLGLQQDQRMKELTKEIYGV